MEVCKVVTAISDTLCFNGVIKRVVLFTGGTLGRMSWNYYCACVDYLSLNDVGYLR